MHHNNTILGQMLQMFSRYEFQKAVSETKTEYHSRGFSSWNHFVSMLFGQLSGQDSLRGIEAGLATQLKYLYHFGAQPIHRSTLSYANEHRSHELFQKTFYWMLSKCKDIAPKHKFRFKNPLYSLDASLIHLCLSLYDWAKFRTAKGAIKLHLKLNHAGYLPAFCVLTTGKVPDQKIAPFIPFERRDVVIFDKGYTDFAWYKTLDDKGVYFVTRLKDNAHYKVTSRKKTDSLTNIYSDQVIKFKRSHKRFPKPLRRIRSKDQETGKVITLLANNFTWSARTIAQIYKERWQIELFFKTLKQQLKVKSFVGTSKNALLSQLWVALIAYLLLSYLKFKSKFNWSLYTLCSIMPTNLFSRRNLWDWLNEPFHEHSNAPPELLQQQFTFC